MGFRSTFTTEDKRIRWPEWCLVKYAGVVHFPDDHKGPISSVYEYKMYGVYADLPKDIQRAIAEEGSLREPFVVVFLHECGGITRCEIRQDSIRWSEPTGWLETEGSTHEYCYGCSSLPPGEANAKA